MRSLPPPEGVGSAAAWPPRLSDEAQRALEEEFMPAGADAPRRLHNKARAKQAMLHAAAKTEREAEEGARLAH